MKTLGMIGGTGYPTTIEYYRLINEMVNKRLGGMNFAQCMIYSFNYGVIDALNKQNDMQGLFTLLLDACDEVVMTGVDALMLCANTIHMFADRLQDMIPVPIIHIADATADHILAQKIDSVALMGTKYTMEMDFYKTRLEDKNIRVIIPDRDDRKYIHDTIMDELVKNMLLEETKERYIGIINKLKEEGAEGIVLGCTEIPLLIKPEDHSLPLFNTLEIHASAAVDFVLE